MYNCSTTAELKKLEKYFCTSSLVAVVELTYEPKGIADETYLPYSADFSEGYPFYSGNMDYIFTSDVNDDILSAKVLS